jgi:GDP-L-fucose synthase
MLIDKYDDKIAINVGCGAEVTILELAKMISKVVGFNGSIEFDLSKPNGTPRKLLDSSVIRNLGWEAQIDIESGLASTYDWFLSHEAKGKMV